MNTYTIIQMHDDSFRAIEDSRVDDFLEMANKGLQGQEKNSNDLFTQRADKRGSVGHS